MTQHGIDLEPLTGALGAEVRGIDLSRPIDQDVLGRIKEALLEHLVLIFPEQDLTPEQHKALGARFGTLNLHPFVEGLEGHPEIIEIIKEKGEQHNWGEGWHSDVSFLEEPSMGSLLYAREIPPYCGDTLYANMYLAYETLSKGMKAMLDGLVAVHSSGAAEEFSGPYLAMRAKGNGEIRTEHPVVRSHPETGRKVLYVNRVFTRRFKDMTEAESRPLLGFLCDHAERPEFTCRIRWRENSLVFWDNRATMHHAVADYFPSRVGVGFRRRMHRVTVNGDRPR